MRLAIAFTDQSHSFTNGVEFGRLLAKMERGDTFISNSGFPIHEANREVIERACVRYAYLPHFSPSMAEGWIEFTATKISQELN